jgi:site-specific DNA-methyltransferase (adenine-specific)
MRYLGNKNALVTNIIDEIRNRVPKDSKVLDCFGGTGCVARELCNHFEDVSSCDMNHYAYVLCYCRTRIPKDTCVDEYITQLNTVEPIHGLITKLYSPEGGRKYFTTENAAKIDAMREQIRDWDIDGDTRMLLLGNLIESVSKFSNIPGTYGAYNETWDPRALKPFVLEKLIDNTRAPMGGTYKCDAKCIIDGDYDVIYMDPPYNQRNYATYYHVLETLSVYDENVQIKDNKTGTPTRVQQSMWCSRPKCVNELREFMYTSKAKLIIMSYNNEGIIPDADIADIFKSCGDYECVEFDHKRFTCNGKGESKVVERLHICTRRERLDWKNQIFNECCLSGMESHIPNASVDLICTDLPYGVTECKWDTVIDLDMMWKEYKRVLKPYGTIVLFGQQPFTSRLVSSNYEMFKYSLVWKKSKPGGFAQAPYKVLCEHEDILVFSNGKTSKNAINKMTYNPQGTVDCNKVMKGKTGDTEHRKGRKVQDDYVQTVTNYPRSVIEFKNEGKCIHPTQKPIHLIEYLVKTFSNEGDVVLDSCMGSATLAIACMNTRRDYTGFEKDEEIFNKSLKRLSLV